jgi:short-subunit dehydrogenase
MRILICGASGNLGSELARQLAQPGTRLSLWGRNQERLNGIAKKCREAGARIATRSLDLADLSAAIAAMAEEDDTDPFDVVLLVAGQGDTRAPGRIVEDALQVARLGIANYVAPSALAAEIAGRMAQRKRGRIALVGTAAASHSLPFAAAYCGSKAGLSRFADALRLAVKGHGVTVTLVSPGFFASGAAGKGARGRPAEIPVGVVAERMILAIARGKAELITPWPFAALRWIGCLMPRALRDRLLLSLTLP